MPPVNVLLPLLIVAVAPDAPIEARYPEAATVFHCSFDGSWDEDFDQWPDRWTRRRGQGFPHYVSIKIDRQPSPQGEECLRIELDGGAAAAYSPPIEIDPLFGYVLEGYLKAEGLNYDRAYFSVTLLDQQRQRLETFYCEKVRQTPGWQKFRLGPISPASDDARLAIIGLHVQPEAPTKDGSREDLKGIVCFADVWLGRLPRLALNTTGAYNYFDQAEQVEVNCVASGLVDQVRGIGDRGSGIGKSEGRRQNAESPSLESEIRNPKSEIPNLKSEIPNPKSEIPNPEPPDPQNGLWVTFQLEDVLGHELARVERPLETLPAEIRGDTLPTDSAQRQVPEPTSRAPWPSSRVPWPSSLGHAATGADAPTNVGTAARWRIYYAADSHARANVGVAPQIVDTAPQVVGTAPRDPQQNLIGKTTWQPPVPGPGFYRVRATMQGRRGLVLRQELSLAVFDRQQVPSGGEFGWSLPRGDRPLPLPLLSRLVCQAGVNWVKYPLWYDPQRGDELIEELITFGGQLGQQGIELVGLLPEPPGPTSGRYPPSVGAPRPADDRPRRPRPAAEVFAADPKTWYPSLEPVMARMATRVRWWQLGDDRDTSFADCPNVAGKIARVKAELDRIGRDVNLGMGWRWIDELPQAAPAVVPWRFVSLSADPPLTHHELATYLDASQQSKLQRWVVIEPLSKDDYPIDVRATDLVRRMIAAKIHGADAIFCPDPFGTERGLLGDDGTPGELLFTWRTTARMLGGATYLGSLQLPQGSPNQLFARGDDVVMVVWNDPPAVGGYGIGTYPPPRGAPPTEEILYLGEDVRQIDLWGRSVRPTEQDHCQVIRVGQLPSFVTGLHGPITRWRLGFALAENKIPSLSDHPQKNSLRLKNHFGRPVVGRATLVVPEGWKLNPAQANFALAAGEQSDQGLEILLPPNAGCGRQAIRADFEVEADRSYRFSVYRYIDVGSGDVYIETATRLNDQGELEVQQRLVNQGKAPVSFRCQLFAPNRRRLHTQVINLRPGQDDQLYRLPDGQQLIGQTLWLRADEMGAPRVLNYRFQAKP